MASLGLATRRRPRRFRPGLWAMILFVPLLLLALGGPWYFVRAVVHPPRSPLRANPASAGLAFKPVAIETAQAGQTLKGWWLPAAGSRTAVVLVHDYGADRLLGGAALPLAKGLVAAGYSVLLFDQRGHGESTPGSHTTFGGEEARDLTQVIAHVQGLGARQIILMGHALGANTVLRAAAGQTGVTAMVLDSPLPDPVRAFTGVVSKVSLLPDFFFTRYIRFLSRVAFRVTPEILQPQSEIAGPPPRPTLLILGAEGTAWGERLLHLSGRPGNEMLVIASATDNLYAANPELYTARLLRFLDHTVGNR